MGVYVADLLEALGHWSANWWWAIASVIVVYVFQSLKYWRLVKNGGGSIQLAPVVVRGGIVEKLGGLEVGIVLRAQLNEVLGNFNQEDGSGGHLYMCEAVGNFFHNMDTALMSVSMKSDGASEDGVSQVKLEEDLIVKLGTIQIPVGAIARIVSALLRVVPVPFRSQHRRNVIHVSLVSVGDATQLLVYREGAPKRKDTKQRVTEPTQLTHSEPVKNLEDLGGLLRDAAFMVLQLHGQAFPEQSGRSMRHFAEGLGALDQYRRTGEQESLEQAKNEFCQASLYDPEHYEALFFFASLLLLGRSRRSISQAKQLLTRALKTEKPKLKALVHAGLAHCLAQESHRLAKHDTRIVDQAMEHARLAESEWGRSGEKKPHIWIETTLVLVKHMDEGTEKNRPETRKRFFSAANDYLRLLNKAQDNARLNNNLGWVLLKLNEWETEELTADMDGVKMAPALRGQTALMAEQYLRQAIDLHSGNKMTHANLCLLYATHYFRGRKGVEWLRRCRYHGLKAIRIDPEYVNGHRDLAFSLLRYGEDDGKQYFTTALRLALVIDKDLELLEDAAAVLEEVGASEEVKEAWLNPSQELIEPPREE